jgi:hypothetical protein
VTIEQPEPSKHHSATAHSRSWQWDLKASITDGSNFGTMLRYAKEVDGLRIAAGIAYEHYGQVSSQADCVAMTLATANACHRSPSR